MIDGAALPLWQRFPVAAQRLRAALLDATFPQARDAAAWITPTAAGCWLVRVTLPATGACFAETFSGVELRAYRGRWDEWTAALASQVQESAAP